MVQLVRVREAYADGTAQVAVSFSNNALVLVELKKLS